MGPESDYDFLVVERDPKKDPGRLDRPMADGVVSHEKRLRATYEAFNARDVDAALSLMRIDVDWPNAWEGGRVHGHEGVRDYWMRQWRAMDPTVEPVAFTTRSDDSIAVEAHQVARGVDGSLLAEGRVLHVYVFRDDLVVRMDVEEPATSA